MLGRSRIIMMKRKIKRKLDHERTTRRKSMLKKVSKDAESKL